jgi:uncharacterized protein YaaN involved in tellurite resistance
VFSRISSSHFASRERPILWNGKSVTELADHVLPALTAAMSLLGKQAMAEADNFRNTILVAIEAAQTHQDKPSPIMTEMTRKITAALDAASATPEVAAAQGA